MTLCHESADYAPFIVDDNGASKGLLVDILRDAARNTGIKIDFYSTSWKRCKSDVEAGRAQALFAMIHTRQRAKRFTFPPKEKLDEWYLWQAKYPVFTRVDSLPFDPASYEPEFGIGAPLGYVAADILKDKGWLSPIHYTPSEGLKMVALKKLDGYVVERDIGAYITQRLEVDAELHAQPYTLLTSNWHVAFNHTYYKAHQSDVVRFWSEMAKVRQRVALSPEF